MRECNSLLHSLLFCNNLLQKIICELFTQFELVMIRGMSSPPKVLYTLLD